MNLNFDAREIRLALFSIPNDKSPGIDGYSSQFFKKSWNNIRSDFIAAIQNFFSTDTLLTELNVTTITLIPKVKCLVGVGDYRPIAFTLSSI